MSLSKLVSSAKANRATAFKTPLPDLLKSKGEGEKMRGEERRIGEDSGGRRERRRGRAEEVKRRGQGLRPV